MNLPDKAPLTLSAATALPTNTDTVAHREPRHTCSDLVDAACDLMTRHNGKWELTEIVVDRMHIGMAHPAMRHPHTYFTNAQ
jgi:hypothetical protein